MHALSSISKGSGPAAGRAVRIKFKVIIQIFYECGVILLATQYVSEQELSLRGIGRLQKRFAGTFLRLFQAVQTEQRPAQGIMTRPGGWVQIQTRADDGLGLGKFLLVVEDRTQSKQRMRVLSAAQSNGFPKGLLCVRDAPQFQVRHSHLVVGLVKVRKFRDGALKLRQASRCIFFCEKFDALLEGVNGLGGNAQLPDGNHIVRFRGLRPRKEWQTQACDE